jgi:DNA polymerase-3 subunit epsilon
MRQDQRQLSDVTFLALDTETTGLFPIVHRLVEVGAVRFRLDGRNLATFQQFIDPQMPIPDDAQQVHGITNQMVRGQPTIAHVLPRFIDFLGAADTILLAHNALFDLGFLAIALTRLGIAFPTHCLFDTLDLARGLYPAWPRHSLETVAAQLKIGNGAEHRALPDARLVKEVFLTMLQRAGSITTIADLARRSPLLTFSDAPVFAIAPPAAFEPLATAMAERCAMMMVYARGLAPSGPRKITPRLLLEVHGVAYVIAYCHQGGFEKTFRLDRIQDCWLE